MNPLIRAGFVLVLLGAIVVVIAATYSIAHDAGYHAGQRDLCGELGGTHVVEDATYSWCDR